MISNKSLLSVRDLVKIYKLSAKSQLSQNFILDKNVTDKIVKSSQIDSNDLLVVEVGAGPGLLTRSILDTGITNMIAVEKDKRFLPALMQLSEASRGNLPFNVASPLLIQWMKMLYKREGIFKFPNVIMTLMFQKEVGDRIAASVKDPERSRISVLVQSLSLSKPVLNVPVDNFEEVVRYFYGRRRKTLRSIFKTIKSRISPTEQGLLDYNLEKLEWDLTLRPEKISSEEFCKLTKIFIENSIKFPT
ncbi:2472_t:CDS:2 [Diversispora eburnea]|uniref:rRNA adenine N(6)-methyltransferase n=1 Tax=Diversispora eburnea TaxID=1213867 RepID=A0A9N9C9L8_9GLOM|nr:2472_t:CDS:2 [Diversispora eburnea]